jgi:hypothetical protein
MGLLVVYSNAELNVSGDNALVWDHSEWEMHKTIVYLYES